MMARCMMKGIIPLISRINNTEFSDSVLTEGNLPSIVSSQMTLEKAIVETILYSDIFDYPLKLDELHRFLVFGAEKDEMRTAIDTTRLVSFREGYYYLTGRGEVVELRKRREISSRRVFKRAMFYGHILGALPFIRMVALTGSLAMLNLSKNQDMDFMLVVKEGRVWTARAFAILLGKFTSLFGDTICPNLIVSENALEWPLHDLYSAHELGQMIPVSGFDFYHRLFEVNLWVRSLLPNLRPQNIRPRTKTVLKGLIEYPLRGALGDKLEKWEMDRKIHKFSAQPGFGSETVFNADVCQGNFHHHRKWTHAAYQERLSSLDLGFEKNEIVQSVNM